MVGLKKRLVEAEARQREIANRDPLTGIGNRRAFDAVLRRELAARLAPPAAAATTTTSPLALLILDLDDFKGDQRRPRPPGRRRGPRQAAERAGGDPALDRHPRPDRRRRVRRDRPRRPRRGRRAHGGSDPRPRSRPTIRARAGPAPDASVGLAVFPEDGKDFETLLRAADQRLLRLKSDGSHFSPRGRGTLRLI